MNDRSIITVYVVIDDLSSASGFEDDGRASSSAVEILTVGVVARCTSRTTMSERCACLTRLRYITELSVSHFNRRLHALQDWLVSLVSVMMPMCTHRLIFIMDSMPLPVCKRVRARHSQKVRGKVFFGYCASKKGSSW